MSGSGSYCMKKSFHIDGSKLQNLSGQAISPAAIWIARASGVTFALGGHGRTTAGLYIHLAYAFVRVSSRLFICCQTIEHFRKVISNWS